MASSSSDWRRRRRRASDCGSTVASPFRVTGLLCATIRLGAARRADLGTILGAPAPRRGQECVDNCCQEVRHSCLDAARTGNVNGPALDFVHLRPPPSHPASQSACAWLKRRGGPRGVPLRADQCPAHHRLRFSPATATSPEATDGRDTTLRSRRDGVLNDSGSGAEPSNRNTRSTPAATSPPRTHAPFIPPPSFHPTSCHSPHSLASGRCPRASGARQLICPSQEFSTQCAQLSRQRAHRSECPLSQLKRINR